MRPHKDHWILCRRMLTDRQPPKHLLGPRRIVIQHRHQSESVPRPCLVRIFRQNFLKRCLCRARIFLGDPPLAFCERRDDLCIIRHRRWRGASLARHFFSCRLVVRLGRLGEREFHRRQPLGLSSDIDGSHQIRKKKFHRGFGVFEFGQRREERFHQNVAFFVPAQRRFPLAGRYALEFQFHCAYCAL